MMKPEIKKINDDWQLCGCPRTETELGAVVCSPGYCQSSGCKHFGGYANPGEKIQESWRTFGCRIGPNPPTESFIHQPICDHPKAAEAEEHECHQKKEDWRVQRMDTDIGNVWCLIKGPWIVKDVYNCPWCGEEL